MFELARVVAGIGRHNVAVSDQLVFVDQKTFHTDRAARMRFVRADADFRAEAVTKSIGEAG